jgi:hypothetical protein
MKGRLGFLAVVLAAAGVAFGAQQTINVGTTANDGTGDSLRGAMQKVNTNFADLYSHTYTPQASDSVARINADGTTTWMDSAATANWLGATTDGALNSAMADPNSNVNFLASEWKIRLTLDQVPNFPAATQADGTQGTSASLLQTPATASATFAANISGRDDKVAANATSATRNSNVNQLIADLTAAGLISKIYFLADLTTGSYQTIINQFGAVPTFGANLTSANYLPVGISFCEASSQHIDTGLSSASLDPTNLTWGVYMGTDRRSSGEVCGFLNTGTGAGRYLFNPGNQTEDKVYFNIGDTGTVGLAGAYPDKSGLWAATSTGTTGQVYWRGAAQGSTVTSAAFHATGNLVIGRGEAPASTTYPGIVLPLVVVGQYLTSTQVATLTTILDRYVATRGLDIANSATQAHLRALAERTFSRVLFTFTGGPCSGKTGFAPAVGYANELYIRDFSRCYRADPAWFAPSFAANQIAAIIGIQRTSDGAIYDGITQSGTAIAVNSLPAYDNIYELIDAIYTHYKQTGSPTLYSEYYNQIKSGLSYVPITNHLVYIADNATLTNIVVGDGFEDQVAASGYNLPVSCERFRSLKEMAEMDRAIGTTALLTEATSYDAEETAMQSAVDTYLWDSGAGAYKTATIKDTEHGVRENAYAVITGLATTNKAAVITWIYNGLTTNSYIDSSSGFSTHLESNESWDAVRTATASGGGALGTYQNGGAWPDGVGFEAAAIQSTYPAAAATLLSNCAAGLRAELDSNAPREWVMTGGVTTYIGVANNCVSAATPLAAYTCVGR